MEERPRRPLGLILRSLGLCLLPSHLPTPHSPSRAQRRLETHCWWKGREMAELGLGPPRESGMFTIRRVFWMGPRGLHMALPSP